MAASGYKASSDIHTTGKNTLTIGELTIGVISRGKLPACCTFMRVYVVISNVEIYYAVQPYLCQCILCFSSIFYAFQAYLVSMYSMHFKHFLFLKSFFILQLMCSFAPCQSDDKYSIFNEQISVKIYKTPKAR